MLDVSETADGTTKFRAMLTDFGMSKAIPKSGTLDLPVGTPMFMAPELLGKLSYNENVDIWALGVLVFNLLTSEYPWTAKNPSQLLRNIHRSKLNTSKLSVFEDGGEKVKAFITKALQIEPKKRATAEELLQDDWITSNIAKAATTKDQGYQIIHNFALASKLSTFQNNILTYLSNMRISEEEQNDLYETFRQIDKNSDGFIDASELKHLSSILGKMKQECDILKTLTVEGLLQSLDTNADGRLSLDEFMKAACNQSEIINSENLRVAYNLLDKNSDGKVNSTELFQVFESTSVKGISANKRQVVPKHWENMIKEIDQNNDGMVSYEEFEFYMKQAIEQTKESLVLDSHACSHVN